MAKSKCACDKDFCCKVDSLVSVDDRGQMVLPKEMRDKAGIRPGDKLALLSLEKGGRLSCIVLVKAENFAELVKEYSAIVMKGMMPK
jgi:AbrB family looped-hinge helix DNA binding protein